MMARSAILTRDESPRRRAPRHGGGTAASLRRQLLAQDVKRLRDTIESTQDEFDRLRKWDAVIRYCWKCRLTER